MGYVTSATQEKTLTYGHRWSPLVLELKGLNGYKYDTYIRKDLIYI